MILEGLVTTIGPDGSRNLAPMGPRLFPPYQLSVGATFELRPYNTSQTAANLRWLPQGVLHVTDDVGLLARAAISQVDPPCLPAFAVNGWVVTDACRAAEFRILSLDDSQSRWSLIAEVVYLHRFRDFFGLNRAMHAVVEAAILATRTRLLPHSDILAGFARLAILVDKTGGPREHEAFEFLRTHVERETSGVVTDD